MSPRVVLVGPMGVGKSTVGQLLAERLGVGYRDTDDDIVAAQDRTIAEIFVDEGESAFRAIEKAAVLRALTEHDGVLALGGGAILDEDTRAFLAGLLADVWGVPARDTDADVEAAEGRSISDIFVDSGETHFRALEAAAVAEALTGHDGVLALGGGAMLDPATRELLAGQTVVFLRVGLSDAVKRVGLGSSRPLLLGNVRGRIKTLLGERTPIYESVATLVVDTDGRTPDEVAAEIVEALP